MINLILYFGLIAVAIFGVALLFDALFGESELFKEFDENQENF